MGASVTFQWPVPGAALAVIFCAAIDTVTVCPGTSHPHMETGTSRWSTRWSVNSLGSFSSA